MILWNFRGLGRTRGHYAVWTLVCFLCAISLNSFACLAFGGEIHKAAMNGDVVKVKALLKADPSLVSSIDDNGMTPLEALACTLTRQSALELSIGSNFNGSNKETEVITPFDSPEALETAELLIDNGAVLNGEPDREGALLRAIGQKNWKMAELLIKKGAKVDVIMPKSDKNYGKTPLHLAAAFGSVTVAKMLIENKAKVDVIDNDGGTPLHSAAGSGHKDVVELLIANGADVNAKDKEGLTPLWWAEALEHSDVAELLRQHGGHK
jgi:ankyrin repeat protein